jgi:hypothetical protein
MMEGFFKRIMTLDGGEDRKIVPAGVYHLKAKSDAAGTRNAAVKAKRAKERRAIKFYARKMSHRKMKLDGLYDFSLGEKRYVDFLPLHSLWNEYMTALMSKFGPGASLEQLGTKILK